MINAKVDTRTIIIGREIFKGPEITAHVVISETAVTAWSTPEAAAREAVLAAEGQSRIDSAARMLAEFRRMHGLSA